MPRTLYRYTLCARYIECETLNSCITLDYTSQKEKISKVVGFTHQQNDRNVKKIELKKEGYRDAPMTPRDHFMKRKLGVKGPLDLLSKIGLPWDFLANLLSRI